ncbi:MAG: SET domain-containing protein [Verrucomicrobia bacterium]|nr:SET domain-containing protein [Verrucomicrobiota bacterium]
MILVPARVAPSGIHGNGLFALASIAQGTPIWRFLPGFDQAFSPEAWAALPEPALSHTRHFCFVRRGDLHVVLSGDHACFINHSEHPNTGLPHPPDRTLHGGGPSGEASSAVTTVALRPIAAGEEITCNYWNYDADTPWKLGRVPRHAPLGACPP